MLIQTMVLNKLALHSLASVAIVTQFQFRHCYCFCCVAKLILVLVTNC